MKHNTLLTIALTLLSTTSGFSQDKARVIIKKNINGEETKIEKEVEISELESFLEEEGVEMELELNADTERVIEVYIDKEDSHGQRDYSYKFHQPKPFLGVTPGEAENDHGVLIGKVVEGSAAEAAGLLAGDIILEMNDETVSTFDDIKDIIWSMSPGEEVMIRYDRDGKRAKTTALLGVNEKAIQHERHSDTSDWNFRWDGEEMDELRMKLDEQLSKLKDIEFDFDKQEFMDVMDDVKKRMGEQMDHMQFDFDWDMEEDGNLFEFNRPGNRSETVVIIMEEIAADEASAVNTKASPKLSTVDNLRLSNLRYFPNPGNGYFDLQFGTPETGDLEVIIFDGQGKKVYYEMLADFKGDYANSIDISNRLAGNYFIQIAQNGKTYSRKLIKE
jgi:hypothetical protein